MSKKKSENVIIAELKNEILRLNEELNKERLTSSKYEQVLEEYHIINEDLRREREYNQQNIHTLNTQRMLIEKYEGIIGRISFNERVI